MTKLPAVISPVGTTNRHESRGNKLVVRANISTHLEGLLLVIGDAHEHGVTHEPGAVSQGGGAILDVRDILFRDDGSHLERNVLEGNVSLGVRRVTMSNSEGPLVHIVRTLIGDMEVRSAIRTPTTTLAVGVKESKFGEERGQGSSGRISRLIPPPSVGGLIGSANRAGSGRIKLCKLPQGIDKGRTISGAGNSRGERGTVDATLTTEKGLREEVIETGLGLLVLGLDDGFDGLFTGGLELLKVGEADGDSRLNPVEVDRGVAVNGVGIHNTERADRPNGLEIVQHRLTELPATTGHAFPVAPLLIEVKGSVGRRNRISDLVGQLVESECSNGLIRNGLRTKSHCYSFILKLLR